MSEGFGCGDKHSVVDFDRNSAKFITVNNSCIGDTVASIQLTLYPEYFARPSFTLCKGISLIGEWQDALFDSIKTFFTDNMLHLTSIFSGNFGIHTKTD